MCKAYQSVTNVCKHGVSAEKYYNVSKSCGKRHKVLQMYEKHDKSVTNCYKCL